MNRSFAIVLGCLLLGGQTVNAGLSAPIPSGRISEDGKRILILRPYPATNMPSWTGYNEDQIRFPTNHDGTRIDIISDFPVSGIYSLPDRQLIHRIDWFSLSAEVRSTPDLVHIVRVNRFGDPWALKFYAEGVEIRSYILDDLLRHFRKWYFRPFTTWDWYYKWVDTVELSGATLNVKTVDRVVLRWNIGYSETYQFDLRTGQMLMANVICAGFLARCLVAAIALAALGSLIWSITRCAHRRKAMRT